MKVYKDTSTYLYYTVQGYLEKVEGGMLIEVAEIQVIATSEIEAIDMAKKLLKKPFYRVSKVAEFFYPVKNDNK